MAWRRAAFITLGIAWVVILTWIATHGRLADWLTKSPDQNAPDAVPQPSEPWNDAGKPPATAPFASAFHGGGALLGVAESFSGPPLKMRWTYAADPTGDARIVGAAAIAGDSVYIADGNGVLHAIDLRAGNGRWQYKSESGFETTPLVIGDTIYLGDLGGKFHAVSSDGHLRWSVDVGSAVYSSANAAIIPRPTPATTRWATSSPATRTARTNGTVTAVLFGTEGGQLFCLDAASGQEIWQASAGARINGSPAVHNNMVIFGGCDQQLHGVRLSDGEAVFDVELGDISAGSTCVADDYAVVPMSGNHMACYNVAAETPGLIWEDTELKGGELLDSAPSCAHGVVVFGTRERCIYGLDLATGKTLWMHPTRGDFESSTVISSGRVYAACMDRKLYVLDLKTGRELWSFTADHPLSNSPLIAGGVVIIADIHGGVYCLEPARKR